MYAKLDKKIDNLKNDIYTVLDTKVGNDEWVEDTIYQEKMNMKLDTKVDKILATFRRISLADETHFDEPWNSLLDIHSLAAIRGASSRHAANLPEF